MSMLRILVGLLITLEFAMSAGAQLSSGATGEAAARFHATSTLVLLPVTVTDRKGRPVTGLLRESFAVAQDNVPQTIVSFGGEDVPVSIGMVFDTSGSMRSVLRPAGDLLRSLLGSANEGDEAFLYTVSSHPGIDGTFTPDLGALLSRSAFFRANGSTALIDTVYAALQACRASHNSRRALVVISDGMDNHSRYSKRELMAVAEEAGTPIFTLSVFEPASGRKPIELREESQGISFLEELSRRSGGLQVVANPTDILRSAERIGEAIRSQYLIGYYPVGVPEERKWHPVKVNTKVPGAKAFTRPGLSVKPEAFTRLNDGFPN